MNILLRDFNANTGREDILKLSTGNESLHKINNTLELRVVNFATAKNRTIKKKYVCTS
jgi:hypothetical protein